MVMQKSINYLVMETLLFLQLTVTDTKIHLIIWDCASFDVTLSHK